MKRGTTKKTESGMVALWVPRPLLAAIDAAITREDSDRSKFIRRAVRARLISIGITVQE